MINASTTGAHTDCNAGDGGHVDHNLLDFLSLKLPVPCTENFLILHFFHIYLAKTIIKRQKKFFVKRYCSVKNIIINIIHFNSFQHSAKIFMTRALLWPRQSRAPKILKVTKGV